MWQFAPKSRRDAQREEAIFTAKHSAASKHFSTLIRLGIEQGEFIPQPETLCATALVGAMAETVIIPLQQARHDANTDTTPLTQSHCQQIVAFCLRAVVKPEHIV